MSTSLDQQLLALRPPHWPTAPAYFQQLTPAALEQQLAFYERCYGAHPRATLGLRAQAQFAYLEKALALLRAAGKSGAVMQAPDAKYAQLLSDLD